MQEVESKIKDKQHIIQERRHSLYGTWLQHKEYNYSTFDNRSLFLDGDWQ